MKRESAQLTGDFQRLQAFMAHLLQRYRVSTVTALPPGPRADFERALGRAGVTQDKREKTIADLNKSPGSDCSRGSFPWQRKRPVSESS